MSVNIYIFIHQKMIATKQIRKNEKLDSGHNIENTVTTRLHNIITIIARGALPLPNGEFLGPLGSARVRVNTTPLVV